MPSDNKLIAILALKVEPELHVIDQTFRFQQPEQSFHKRCYKFVTLLCLQQIKVLIWSLQAAVGSSPQQKRFFICIYSDPIMSKPDQIWQFYVHALQRVNRHAVIEVGSVFLLARRTNAGAVHELYVGVKPLQSGSKFFYLNIVDIECHQLIRNWLICVTCSLPVISKTFELHLPAAKTFVLTNNRNDLLQFKETRLDMHPKKTRVIGLLFMSALTTGSVELLVFIKDDKDKNEETFFVKVNYILEEDED
ncbi:nephrocystin-4-like [Watersipora subatra]|uniref:nephrocystin-4-like n=1 Tax=Watersipora subatra TaxID=2589382 RepID=UPI00355C9459